MQTTFWSGVGISCDPPTSGPIGVTLTRRALDLGFDGPTVEDRLTTAYRELAVFDGRRIRALPRLETVLDVAVAEHGVEMLAAVLEDLMEPEPNALHRFFAQHLSVGGQHVTANFDTCIERAVDGVDPSQIVHIHGVVGDWAAMGARLSVIEEGFPPHLASQLRGILSRTQLLVVVGYSGLDYFDVDPFWRAMPARKGFSLASASSGSSTSRRAGCMARIPRSRIGNWQCSPTEVSPST